MNSALSDQKLMTRISVGRSAVEPSELSESRQAEDCLVCLMPLLSEEHKLVAHCGCPDSSAKEHWVHYRCLMTWLNNAPTCPVCRAAVRVPLSGSDCFICNATCVERDNSPFGRMKCCGMVLHEVCYQSPGKAEQQCFRCGTEYKTSENWELIKDKKRN